MKSVLKLKHLTVEEIASATGGCAVTVGNGGMGKVTNVIYDSRDAEVGSLFCAVKGERADGHDYIVNTVRAGASVVLCNRIPKDAEGENFTAVLVDDTVDALGKLSGYYRSFSNARFVAVTGSVGKTTTKDFIASVARSSFNTLKTQGNHNNEIGLPMTLFSLTPECEVAVLEMGMCKFGEISFMTKLVRPDIAVVTNIGTSHIASLGSRENICRAKLEITEGMAEDSVLLLNGDEPLLTERKALISPAPRYMGIYSRSADFKAMNIRTSGDGMVFDVLYGDRAAINMEIPILGRHNVYNAMAAFAVGTFLGMSEERIRAGLATFEGTEMRQKILKIGKITVIEDCYNASPESMRAAIDVLCAKAKKEGGRATALLGDMLELGENTRLMHDQLGQYAAQMKIERLYCFGAMADTVAEAAIKKGIRADSVFVFPDLNDPETVADEITKNALADDILLVKASRGVAAERVISLMAKSKKKRSETGK